MSKYRGLMLKRGVMQKDVSESVRKVDPRVDTALMSKFVNDVCLPTPPVLKAICKTLSCDPLDIYDPREIALAPTPTAEETPATGGGQAVNADTARTRERRRKNDFYNLTVEIPRDVAERVFAPDALRKLGYLSKSDCVRHLVAELDSRLTMIEFNQQCADYFNAHLPDLKKEMEKAADAGTSNGKND